MKYTEEYFENWSKEHIDNPRMPYHRCYRPLVERGNSSSYELCYLIDDDYAVRPFAFTRAFEQLQNEMKQLFLYVEPAYHNRKTYSYHIQQLFIRVCIELEANFKAIFKENTYSRDESKWNVYDYWKINTSHKLSEYTVIMPTWEGKGGEFQPFKEWKDSPRLKWYKAFQRTKHNRINSLKEANLYNLVNAFCGLFVVLTAQFKNHEYSTTPVLVSAGIGSYYDGEFGIGDMLQVIFPEWDDTEKYDVDWSEVCTNPDRFRKFNYDVIPDFQESNSQND